jgi:hypothetical protein
MQQSCADTVCFPHKYDHPICHTQPPHSSLRLYSYSHAIDLAHTTSNDDERLAHPRSLHHCECEPTVAAGTLLESNASIRRPTVLPLVAVEVVGSDERLVSSSVAILTLFLSSSPPLVLEMEEGDARGVGDDDGGGDEAGMRPILPISTTDGSSPSTAHRHSNLYRTSTHDVL